MGKINVRGWFNLNPDVAQLVYENARVGKCNEFVETAVMFYIRNRKELNSKNVDRKKYERHYKAAVERKNGNKITGNEQKS